MKKNLLNPRGCAFRGVWARSWIQEYLTLLGRCFGADRFISGVYLGQLPEFLSLIFKIFKLLNEHFHDAVVDSDEEQELPSWKNIKDQTQKSDKRAQPFEYPSTNVLLTLGSLTCVDFQRYYPLLDCERIRHLMLQSRTQHKLIVSSLPIFKTWRPKASKGLLAFLSEETSTRGYAYCASKDLL
nr:hypothetical protein Iba_chr01cCG13590 [Ipomoea batatas]